MQTIIFAFLKQKSFWRVCYKNRIVDPHPRSCIIFIKIRIKIYDGEYGVLLIFRAKQEMSFVFVGYIQHGLWVFGAYTHFGVTGSRGGRCNYHHNIAVSEVQFIFLTNYGMALVTEDKTCRGVTSQCCFLVVNSKKEKGIIGVFSIAYFYQAQGRGGGLLWEDQQSPHHISFLLTIIDNFQLCLRRIFFRVENPPYADTFKDLGIHYSGFLIHKPVIVLLRYDQGLPLIIFTWRLA